MENIKKKHFFQSDVDLIHGPIFQSLMIFALPLLVSNIFNNYIILSIQWWLVII